MINVYERRVRDTDAPMLNEKLLDRTLQAIIDDPSGWNQSDWCRVRRVKVPADVVRGDVALCGTTACLAGHALLESGQWQLQYVGLVRDETSNILLDARVQFFDLHGKSIHDRTGDEDVIGIEATAGALLGLTRWEASHLFSTSGYTAVSFCAMVRAYLGLPTKTYVPSPKAAVSA